MEDNCKISKLNISSTTDHILAQGMKPKTLEMKTTSKGR
jgi:hypothetical protein